MYLTSKGNNYTGGNDMIKINDVVRYGSFKARVVDLYVLKGVRRVVITPLLLEDFKHDVSVDCVKSLDKDIKVYYA